MNELKRLYDQWESEPLDPAYEWLNDNLEAVHLGIATEVIECNECRQPRGIVKTFTQPAHFPDPSVVLTLSCGHVLL